MLHSLRQGEAFPHHHPLTIRQEQRNPRRSPGKSLQRLRRVTRETGNGITLSTQPGWNTRSVWNLGTKRHQEADQRLLLIPGWGSGGGNSQP